MTYIAFFTTLVIGMHFGKTSSKGYLAVIMLFLFGIIGFRGLSVGTDTPGYINDFEAIKDMTYSQLQNVTQTRWSKEPLYPFITWLVSCFSSSYIAFLLTWAIFPCVSMYIVFKEELKKPKDYMIAILCFFALGFFAFSVAGIRQTAAMSIIFFGYRYIKNFDLTFNPKSLWNINILKFAICLILAFNVHNSSFIFLMILPFLKIKLRWWCIPFVIALFFVSQYLTIDFVVSLSSFIFEDRFATYGTIYTSEQNISAFVMQIILFIICFLQRYSLYEKDKTNIYLFNIVLLGLVFQSFSGMLAEMSRVSFYFSMFMLILVPRAMNEYKGNTRKILYTAFTLLILIYLFSLSGANLPQYTSSLFD